MPVQLGDAMNSLPNLLAALAALTLLASPAQAQDQRFWQQQLNGSRRDLERAMSHSNDLRDSLRKVGDNATGCRLSRELRSTLMDVQVHSEKLSDAAWRLGLNEVHQAAVDLHNAALNERKDMEGGILAQCANLGS